ncbi:hypothetical protein QYF61_015773 [Mycteria americana]|uniref:Uncharacterized protein n=1 Tax=Mycteria americana TaxID=33587 RepID=A0AAN7N896_MYCAM|nr:hypothetical protein QYF61_015773 [Mycteria americana]
MLEAPGYNDTSKPEPGLEVKPALAPGKSLHSSSRRSLGSSESALIPPKSARAPDPSTIFLMGCASRVRCQEWVESQQGWLVAHRTLTPCQRNVPQEERVCHDFKPISARSSSKIHHGMGYDGSALVPMTWWQQYRHCATHPARWAEKHQTSPCPYPRFQLVLPPKTPLQEQRVDAHGAQFRHLLEGWRLNHLPGQPVPMLDNPFSEEKFPNIQSKPPLVQLEAISSCPITCYLGEETDPHLSTTSFQAKQPQLPQPLLIRLLLQTLHQLCCPSLDSLQHPNVSLVVGGPKLNTVFEVRPHQCRVQGHDHFPTPAGHAIFDTSQDAIGFLGHLGTLLAHIQVAVNQHPHVLFCLAAFQPLFPKPVALHGVAVAQVQDLALGLVKPHTIDLGPLIQPVQVPLQSLPTLQQTNTPTQLGVICKLTEGALDPFIQIIDKDIKQNWPQHRALGNTACDRPPTGVNSIHHHSLGPAIQPGLYPAKSTPVQAMSSQFLQENAVGNRVKGFTEV